MVSEAAAPLTVRFHGAGEVPTYRNRAVHVWPGSPVAVRRRSGAPWAAPARQNRARGAVRGACGSAVPAPHGPLCPCRPTRLCGRCFSASTLCRGSAWRRTGCSRSHRAYLSSAPHYDFPRYRQLVHEVTAAFSGISREVLQLQGRLRGELGRPDLAQHLTRLQEREQEKLQLTAQLQLARQRAQDEPSVDTHQQEVRELKHRLIKTIEAISEILQDLKYDSEEAE
uniref:Required for excision 1-B domain containing n=1 Tax=Gallus gallus TaxID=9031 RepID=A0A8V1AIQ3_CHICK